MRRRRLPGERGDLSRLVSSDRGSRPAGRTLPGRGHDDVTRGALIPDADCETLPQKRISEGGKSMLVSQILKGKGDLVFTAGCFIHARSGR